MITVHEISRSPHVPQALKPHPLTLRRHIKTLPPSCLTRSTSVFTGRTQTMYSTLPLKAWPQPGASKAMYATVALLKFHKKNLAVKWVYNFVFFRSPLICSSSPSSPPNFNFSLSPIQEITEPLSIPWHPLQ